VNHDADLLVVRTSKWTAGSDREKWVRIKLSTGTLLGKSYPLRAMPNPSVRFSLSLDAIPRTPLMLVHWYTYSNDRDCVGARFEVIDALGGLVWHIDYPNDYLLPSTGESRKLWHQIREGREFSKIGPGPSFQIDLVADSTTVSFHLKLDRNGRWVVFEGATVPFRFSLDTAQ
jgi:hypothetical protein